MARKSIEGQMDMFELFSSVEELEENVKGVPELDDLPEEQVATGGSEAQSGQAEPETQIAAGELEAHSGQVEPEMQIAADEPEGQSGQEYAAELWRPSAAPVMQRSFSGNEGKNTAVVAYLDYNMVYLQDWEEKPVIYQFEHSRDAVDFYVGQMERFLCDKKVKVQKGQEALREASVIKWTGEMES